MSEFWFDGTEDEWAADWARRNGYVLLSPSDIEKVRKLRAYWDEEDGLAAATICDALDELLALIEGRQT